MASLVKQYAAADAEGRVKLIYRHFSNFPGIIESRVNGLVYLIENEKATNRRLENGDLGVRIQTSNKKDITGNTASSEADTRDAIIICVFSGGILDGTDRGDIFREEAFTLKKMRSDYQLLVHQLGELDEDERKIFLSYIKAHNDVGDIAEKFGIAVDSVRKRIFRTKQKLTEQMVDYMEGEL